MTLQELVDRLHEIHVLVVGDPLQDVYHFGHADRLSPEAPVPVFVEDCQTVRPGGAANVAANLEAAGCMVTVAFPPGDPIRKHRYLVGHHQLFRIDQDRRYAEPDHIPTDRPDAVVISDYAKGACTERVCQEVIERWRGTGVPVVVDPKGTQWGKYRGATLLLPNKREWNDWHASADWQPLTCQVVCKLAERGLAAHTDDGLEEFPAVARHVFDVTGAGDTVTAMIAAALGVGADLRQACRLANIAAGYVVGEVGTAVCPIQTLKELVREAL